MDSVSADMLCIPTRVWKINSYFFLSGVAVRVIICSMAQSGSDHSTVTQVDAETESVEKIAEELLP